ncbi:hypothetical protein BD413DRAFT_483041 [Trametes elegans]|nr:hypothetical protein BD413DRAFT_483041 [Trametes elegans]
MGLPFKKFFSVARLTDADPASCAKFGAGGFDEAPNFTLTAWNVDGSNDNSTGVPLVLASGGATSGGSFLRLATWASYPYNQYPTLSLADGTLIPNAPEGVTPAKASNVDDGAQLGFVSNNNVNPADGAKIYCAVADTDPAGHGTGHAFLAVNGDTGSFSLCKDGSQNVVYYKAAEGNSYDYSSCYPVRVQLIQ